MTFLFVKDKFLSKTKPFNNTVAFVCVSTVLEPPVVGKQPGRHGSGDILPVAMSRVMY